MTTAEPNRIKLADSPPNSPGSILQAGQPLTVSQTAQYLQVSESLVYRELRAGRLQSTKIGRAWRVSKSDLDEYLAH